MKRWYLSLIFLFIGLFLGAQEITISAGGNMGYLLNFIFQNFSSNDISTTTQNLGFGPYLDLTYARLGIDYNMIVAATNHDSSGAHELKDFSISFLNFYLLGKYPFTLGNFKIWPALGIQYAYCLEFQVPNAGGNPTTAADLSDFYLLGGAGFDFTFDNIVISPYLIFCYNLMPQTIKDPPSGFEAYNFSFQLGVSLGYIIK
jgi:hypothetical protein